MRWLIVVLLWVSVCIPLAAEPVTIHVHPRVGMVGQTVNITIRIEPHEANRRLCLVWGVVAEEMYSSSCLQLDGAQRKRTFTWQRTLRIPGEWAIIADLQRNDESSTKAREMVEILGGF